ncbi:unnamed protein product [Schistosoma margrebowiei]|uniref:Uncharacterized protein n=1 Tax=Schistosoma margrebowiei TaxID=48269 RepID=A0A3P7Y0B2_9TREM|nr:unnamed protein product [Schistosoma margrebowiei]
MKQLDLNLQLLYMHEAVRRPFLGLMVHLGDQKISLYDSQLAKEFDFQTSFWNVPQQMSPPKTV